ncbi:MAG TPA: hypothetical protein VJ810_07255 [Blastocatellia bacterium]|nr:hypothetical protein [Blastocatellia bacterium]
MKTQRKFHQVCWLAVCSALVACMFGFGMLDGIVSGQSQTGQERVMGEVVAVDGANKQIAMKTTKGENLTVRVAETTTYGRVPPGATSMAESVPTSLGEIGGGDRMLVVGEISEGRQSITARQVLVISRGDLAKKFERDRERWRQRGISGSVVSVDAEGKSLKARIRAPEGPQTLTVLFKQASQFRRYSSDSVAYKDATASSFDQIKAGDLFRALGDRSEDGAGYNVEEILFGTFRAIPGAVVAVDAGAGEIKFNEFASPQPITAQAGKETYTRRLSNELATALAKSVEKGAAQNQADTNQASFQGQIDKMPTVSLSELKAGDMVLLISPAGEKQPRILAIAIFAGVEPVLKPIQDQLKASKGRPNYKLGLPESLTGFGVALP